MGDSTHIHDHVITLQSFKTMKAIVSNPQNPMPPFEVLLLSLIFPPLS